MRQVLHGLVLFRCEDLYESFGVELVNGSLLFRSLLLVNLQLQLVISGTRLVLVMIRAANL